MLIIDTMVRLDLKFLGTFEVYLGGKAITKFKSKNVQGLLLYLCLHPKKTHSRESLATLFWPDKSTATGKTNLRATLKHLRESLNDKDKKERLIASKNNIGLNKDQLTCDVYSLQGVLKTKRFASAADLFVGEIAGDLIFDSPNFENWLNNLRRGLMADCLLGLETLTDKQLHVANYDLAQTLAQHQLRLDPYNENGLRQLMQATALAHSPNQALRHFNQFKTERADEGEFDLEPKTIELARQIIDGNLAELAPKNPPVRFSRSDRQMIIARLDILPDQKLFGISEIHNRLIKQLNVPSRPWIISIEGMGGLGKTSLSHKIVHTTLDSTRFADIAWVSAKQVEYVSGEGIQPTHKPALNSEGLLDSLLAQLAKGAYPTTNYQAKKQALKEILDDHPTLVVVDNLETVEDYQEVLPLIRFLSQPSKFIITNRMSLQHQTDVYCENLSELSQANTISFLRHEAKVQNIVTLKHVSDEALRDVFKTIGGNPLALKMVLGQSNYLPIEQILQDLILAKGESAEDLYKYIFWQAWNMLDEQSQQVLISLPLAPNGTLQQIENKSQLPRNNVISALNNLRRLSMVEFSVNSEQPRYYLHRLTETFLLNEVVRWQAQDSGVNAESSLFEKQLGSALQNWQGNQLVDALATGEFDREKEALLKMIQLGLDHDPFWPLVKNMILVLSSYVERRKQWGNWLQTIEKALEVSKRLSDDHGALEMANLRGRILQRMGKTTELKQNYRKVIRLAKKAKNPIEEARACSNLGHSFTLQGHYCRSEILNQHALSIFDKHGYEHGQAHTNNHLGLLYTYTKDYDRAKQHVQTACNIWRRTKDEFGLINGLVNLGFLYNELGKPTDAISVLETALNLGESQGEGGYLLATNLMNLGIAHRTLSNYSKALSFSEKAEQIFKDSGNRLSLYHVWENFGHTYSGLGDQTKALDYFNWALDGFKNQSQFVDSSRLKKIIKGLTAEDV